MPETVPAGVSISCEITYHCEHEFSVCSNATFGILREAERWAVDRLGRLPHCNGYTQCIECWLFTPIPYKYSKKAENGRIYTVIKFNDKECCRSNRWSNPMGANFSFETRNFSFAIPATVRGPAGVSISWKKDCDDEISVSSNPPGDPLRGRRPSFVHEFEIETSAIQTSMLTNIPSCVSRWVVSVENWGQKQ